MESPSHPDSPMNDDDIAYPCKGCGEILEEGKAFELAGNRWHIDCFRCNTCKTLLDSDANLLLLGDGSLICNNCTYSCSACQNKIEDLAILTGEQAFCASCFKCRNCRRKIENLRYARTSQGIFCMTCHESLMARRRKKTRQAQNPQQQLPKPSSNSQSPMLLDKSLPSLPPTNNPHIPTSDPTSFSQSTTLVNPSSTPPPQELLSESTLDLDLRGLQNGHSDGKANNRDKPSLSSEELSSEVATLPSTTYNGTPTSQRHPLAETNGPLSPADPMGAFIPMMFDDRPAAGPSPHLQSQAFEQPPVRKDSAQDQARNGIGSDLDVGATPKHPSSRKEVEGRGVTKKLGSPHVAYQEKGRQPSSELTDLIRNRSRREQDRDIGTTRDFVGPASRNISGSDNTRSQHVAPPSQLVNSATGTSSQNEQFRLQEVPRSKKTGSRQGSRSDVPLMQPASATDHQASTSRSQSPAPMATKPVTAPPGQLLSDSRSASYQSNSSQILQKPKREDSLPLAQQKVGGLRKDQQPLQPSKAISSSSPQYTSPPDPLGISMSKHPEENDASYAEVNGARPIPPARSKGRPQFQASDSFPPSRSVPTSSLPNSLPTSGSQDPSPGSAGTVQTDYSQSHEPPTSPSLPQYNHSGDFGIGMEDDFKRILAGNDEGANDLLEKVSKAVRHGRSASEAGVTRQEPVESSAASTVTGPKEETFKLKSELRHSAKRIAELEARLSSTADIKSLDTKLREKRSTVAFLDSQRELVVNELEVLTKHVEQTKKSDKPLDVGALTDSMIKEFALSLEQLKEQYQADIEDLIHQKTQLTEELTNLTRLREQAIQETTQLNMKNSQLADLNNELTQQIQERYKQHRHPSLGDNAPLESPRANGLGIYTHHHNYSGDQRDFRPSTAGNSSLSTVVPQSTDTSVHDSEPLTVLSAPHVVNIRKGQAKKFNWKKGGQTVAKGVSKGMKAAFSSSNQSHTPQSAHHQNPGPMPESVPYGMHTPGEAPMIVHRLPPTADQGKSRNHNLADKLFGANLAARGPSPQQLRSYSNGNMHGGAPDGPMPLFGSDLSERADLERRGIPSVVTRCIEEVELRGMDVEGIYRKTGGNSLTKTIQEGFEQSNEYDISDPELDITSVTSALKQYLRHLPIPLVHYDIYDRILRAIDFKVVPSVDAAIDQMRSAISSLPPKHHDTLEFLIFHLARVVERQDENKMSPRNLAVVFAPTIMWDSNVQREISDMHTKNDAIQFLIEHNKMIFTP